MFLLQNEMQVKSGYVMTRDGKKRTTEIKKVRHVYLHPMFADLQKLLEKK